MQGRRNGRPSLPKWHFSRIKQFILIDIHYCNICNNAHGPYRRHAGLCRRGRSAGLCPCGAQAWPAPSGVTRLIAALEERLGARLLQRTTRQVTLTDAGIALSGAGAANSGRCRGGGGRGRGRAHPAGGPTRDLGAGRFRPAPCQRHRDRLPETLRRRRRSIFGCPTAWSISSRTASILRSGSAICRIRRWWRAMSARCGGSWWPRPAISRRAASRSAEEISAHDTIQFGAMTAALGLALRRGRPRDPRRQRTTICHQQLRRRDPVCGSGRRADAGAGLSGRRVAKAGRLKIVLASFEQPALPIHIVYPTSRLLSAKVRTFIDLVTETADWHFG